MMSVMKSSKNTGALRLAAAVAAVVLGVGAGSAFAGTTTVQFESNPNTTKRKLGSFTGTASYDDATGLLSVTVNNTSTSPKGGSLTGVAFNIAGTTTTARYVDGDDAATPRADEDAFDDARSRKGVVKAKPFGKLDAGAAVNGKWGAASKRAAASGVSAGSSRTFVFDVDNAGAGMTASDFFSGNLGIAASFRGRKPDRVGGVLLAPVPSVPVIPGPDSGNNGGGDNAPPVIDLPDDDTGGGVIPPGDIGGGSDNGTGGNTGGTNGGSTGGGNGSPTAVPLPPAVWTGFAGLAALMSPKLKKKLRRLL